MTMRAVIVIAFALAGGPARAERSTAPRRFRDIAYAPVPAAITRPNGNATECGSERTATATAGRHLGGATLRPPWSRRRSVDRDLSH
jgi:hypothetical protein